MANILHTSGGFCFDTLEVNLDHDDSAINLRVIKTTSLIGKSYRFFIRIFGLGIEKFHTDLNRLPFQKNLKVYSVCRKNLERFVEQIAQKQNITPDKSWAKKILNYYKTTGFCLSPFSLQNLIYISTYQSKALSDRRNDQQMNRNDSYSSEDVYSMKISGICFQIYPCQHECILILRNGQVAIQILNNLYIKSLIDKIPKEKITCPPQPSAPDGWRHFHYDNRFEIKKADAIISNIFKGK